MTIENGNTADTNDIKVSADEMIDELLRINANLNMQLAAANILIRKLTGQPEASTNGVVEEPVPS